MGEMSHSLWSSGHVSPPRPDGIRLFHLDDEYVAIALLAGVSGVDDGSSDLVGAVVIDVHFNRAHRQECWIFHAAVGGGAHLLALAGDVGHGRTRCADARELFDDGVNLFLADNPSNQFHRGVSLGGYEHLFTNHSL